MSACSRAHCRQWPGTLEDELLAAATVSTALLGATGTCGARWRGLRCCGLGCRGRDSAARPACAARPARGAVREAERETAGSRLAAVAARAAGAVAAGAGSEMGAAASSDEAYWCPATRAVAVIATAVSRQSTQRGASATARRSGWGKGKGKT